jgi:hypothetical protein
MIFVSDPWRNEPLNQTDTSKTASETCRNYSYERQVYTVLYAMVPWLRRRDSMWADVVDAYFRYHARRIAKTVRGWAKKNGMLRRYWSRGMFGNGTFDPLVILEETLEARGYI